MTERRTIPDYPDYAIARDGTVWRMTPAANCVEGLRGPSPRPMSVVWVGNGKSTKRYAVVTLCRPRETGGPPKVTKKTVRRLMDEMWPGVGWEILP